MDVLIQDLRFAIRALRRSPGFTAVVVAVMALGIGANTCIFTMVYGVMLRPWPLPEARRIVAVGETEPRRGFNDLGLSWQNYFDLRDRSKSFTAFGGLWDHNAIVTIDKDPERLYAATITADVFPALGVQPVLGRGFRHDEEIWGRNWTQVVISDRIWRDRYKADPNVLGKTLRINGRTREIVGVMPPGFRYPETQDFWIPAGFNEKEDSRTDEAFSGVARLKPGVTWQQADAELKTLMKQIGREHPEVVERSAHAHVLQDWWGRGARPFMIVMLVSVLFVLLIACGNVANLMLARAASRRREISLRLALGASRGRVVRQLLTESVLISLVAAVLGIALARWGNTIWPAGIPLELPFFMHFTLDGPVLAYTALIAVVAGILSGLAPALHAGDGRLSEALREGSTQTGGSRAGRRLRNSLVVAEIAFSLMLLVGAGLMLRTFWKLDQAGGQLRTEGVVTGRVLLPVASYPADSDRRLFFAEMQRRLRALPGVREASAVSHLALGRDSWGRLVLTPDASDPKKDGQRSSYATVMPGYFELIGIPLKLGRTITDQDDERASRVVVVNEALARRMWPKKQNAVGERLRFVGEPDSLGWRTVVGVVGDVVQSVEDNESDNALSCAYVPELQEPVQMLSVLVSSGGGTNAAANGFRQTIKSMNPDLAVTDLRTLREEFRFSLWIRRLFASMLGVFAVLALIIAAVGIYGVMAYSVTQRTQEIGIRMALGAESNSVMRLVVGQAMRLTILGVGIGIAGAFGLTRLMTNVIYGVSPTDPPTYTVVSVVLALSGIIAAWIPAIRATRVDPMVALRCE